MKQMLILFTMFLLVSVHAVASTDPIHNDHDRNIRPDIHSLPAYKAEFDIEVTPARNTLQKLGGIGLDGQELTNDVSEMTLIQGGYFTIGTHHGVSASALDDGCGITFGHPYALTSYPLIAIDGQWGKVASVFNIMQASPVIRNNSLQLTYEQSDLYRFAFTITPDRTGQSITLSTTLHNLDTEPHTMGAGLVFDAGLGRKGDGCVEINNRIARHDTVLTAPSELILHERLGSSDGLRAALNLTFVETNNVIIANWQDIYQNDTPDFSYSELRTLYDVALKIIGEQQTVAAGGSMTQSITITVDEPNFGAVFTRWDLPGFLSIENSLLFPRTLQSFIEISNTGTTTYNNCTLTLNCPAELSSTTPSSLFNLRGSSVHYQTEAFHSNEILEDQIVELSLDIRHNNELLDSMQKYVFIPAIPLSDTGLICTVDTVITSNYPTVQLSFEAQIEKTGQPLLALQREHIFLYENESRIRNFDFGKDTTGGVNKADVVFVLDCSGSMGDDIQAVRSNIGEFADSLIERGVDLKVGVVAFSTTVDDVHDLTDDIDQFKEWLNTIANHLWGGRENSLAALWRATELSLRPDSKHTFVWITDEDYPVSPEINLTVQQVVNRLLEYEVTVHSIGETSLQTQWCNPIIEPTGGKFFNIHGNFRDIMLEISRMKSSGKYMISYISPNTSAGTNNITLELHYAGRGGFGYADYTVGGLAKRPVQSLTCFPNPFNPSVHIMADLGEHTRGELEIYNILGQRVISLPLNGVHQRHVVLWDARNAFGQPVSAGTYFVRLHAVHQHGTPAYPPIQKILYMK